MFRKCLTTLLMVGYLATSLARAPHAHASQPADHDARAHVHFDWFARLFEFVASPAEVHESDRNNDAHQGHHHHHHGHDHHHHADGHGHSHSAPCDVPGNTGEPVPDSEPDHDSTCVYVADEPHVSVTFGTVQDPSRVVAQVAIFDIVVETVVLPALIRPEWAHAPPDTLAAAGDLYLKLRTLRI